MASRRLLLVDDSEVILLTMAALLEDEGYEVVTAGDLAEARRHIQVDRYAAVLLDLHLGEENGLELIPAIRERMETKVIVVTGSLTGSERLDEADAVFTKGGDFHDLSARLAALLG